MFDRVLVPLDGSTEAESVLPWLRSWDLADSKIVLFHCLPSRLPKGELLGTSRFETIEQAQEYLDGVARSFSGLSETLVRTGSPGERIVTTALQAETGLVVLGVAGEFGTARTLGKATEIVAKTCPQPVLVVKTPARPSRRRVRRILAPLDASSRGDENMEVLRGVARDLRAEVILLHVGTPESEKGPAEGASYSDVQLNLIRQVWSFLKDGIAARTIMTKGSIVEETLAHEQSLDVDMVAIPRESQPGVLNWTPLLGRCERAVLLYEPKEGSSTLLPAVGRSGALSVPRI